MLQSHLSERASCTADKTVCQSVCLSVCWVCLLQVTEDLQDGQVTFTRPLLTERKNKSVDCARASLSRPRNPPDWRLRFSSGASQSLAQRRDASRCVTMHHGFPAVKKTQNKRTYLRRDLLHHDARDKIFCRRCDSQQREERRREEPGGVFFFFLKRWSSSRLGGSVLCLI